MTGRCPDGHDLLAAAVIREAVEDLQAGLTNTASRAQRQAAHAAKKFFYSHDLEIWAEVLGVEPEQVRERVRLIVSESPRAKNNTFYRGEL
jgi:hypothetical protein